jgi:hypothetical protein
MKSHINNLKQKHAKLKMSIKSANDHHFNGLEINALKKEKLLIKEKICKLEQSLN